MNTAEFEWQPIFVAALFLLLLEELLLVSWGNWGAFAACGGIPCLLSALKFRRIPRSVLQGTLLLLLPSFALLFILPSADSERHLLALDRSEPKSKEIGDEGSFYSPKRLFSGEATLEKRWRLASGKTRFALVLHSGERKIPALLDGALRSWDKEFELPVPTAIFVEVELQVIKRRTWPWTFGAHLLREGYVATGEVIRLQATAPTQEAQLSSRERLIEELVARYGGRKSLAIVLASTLGEEGLLSSSLKELFKSTSLTHQMVVSGFQVTLLWLLSEGMLKVLLGFLPLMRIVIFRDRLLILLSGSVVFLYVRLLDGDVPSSRAWLALAFVFLSRLLGRSLHSLRSLMMLGYLLLLIFPGSCYELSYQLTFAALLGLQLGSRWGEGRSFLAKAVLFHLGPLLCTTPFLLIWTKSFYPTALFFNLCFGWLFSALFIGAGGIFLVAADLLPPSWDFLGGLYLDCGDFYLEVLGQTSHFLLKWGLGPWELSEFSSWILATALFLLMFRELLQQNSAEYADESRFGCYGAPLAA